MAVTAYTAYLEEYSRPDARYKRRIGIRGISMRTICSITGKSKGIIDMLGMHSVDGKKLEMFKKYTRGRALDIKKNYYYFDASTIRKKVMRRRGSR